MGKLLDSPASYRPSLSPPAYQSFLNASFYPVYSSFWNLIPFSLPARAVSALDGLLLIKFFIFLSILDGFNKPRPGSRTILSTIDFSKAFDSVWHPALFHKLISAGLSPCFARWTQSFLSDRRASVVYQNHKSRSFRVRRGVPQGSVLGPVLFSLFINDLPASLPSSVSCSLYADDLAIWSSYPLVPTAVEATQEALFRLERWSEYWCLPLCGRSGRNCLLSPAVLSDYNGSPDTRFSRGTTRLMSWPDGERNLRPSQSLAVSLLSSLLGVPIWLNW